jgi:hypothetical protein
VVDDGIDAFGFHEGFLCLARARRRGSLIDRRSLQGGAKNFAF